MQSKQQMVERKKAKRAEAMRESLLKRKQQVKERSKKDSGNRKDENAAD